MAETTVREGRHQHCRIWQASSAQTTENYSHLLLILPTHSSGSTGGRWTHEAMTDYAQARGGTAVVRGRPAKEGGAAGARQMAGRPACTRCWPPPPPDYTIITSTASPTAPAVGTRIRQHLSRFSKKIRRFMYKIY
jgi:hypothetical protein